MPLLDASRVINSPMVSQVFTIMRTQQTVNQDGLPVQTITSIPSLGVITHGASQLFLRELGFQLSKDTLYIVTKSILYTVENVEGTQYEPDLVVVNGERYSVRKVFDYSEFGEGFNSAICEIADVAGVPIA